MNLMEYVPQGLGWSQTAGIHWRRGMKWIFYDVRVVDQPLRIKLQEKSEMSKRFEGPLWKQEKYSEKYWKFVWLTDKALSGRWAKSDIHFPMFFTVFLLRNEVGDGIDLSCCATNFGFIENFQICKEQNIQVDLLRIIWKSWGFIAILGSGRDTRGLDYHTLLSVESSIFSMTMFCKLGTMLALDKVGRHRCRSTNYQVLGYTIDGGLLCYAVEHCLDHGILNARLTDAKDSRR